MSQNGRYMLLFSLGPVQTFIAQARKTRDLWIGSLLLSKLMEAAMEGIPGEFIFPAVRTVGDTPDIPNRYIALFGDLSQAQQAASQSKRQIAERWKRICEAVWKEVLARYGDQETRSIWKRQTGVDVATHLVDPDALFEIYWAILEREDGAQYGTWFGETERTLAARKRLRDFKAEEEPGEKSAISGEREILHRGESSPREILEFWKSVAVRHSQMDLDKEGKEHLDAIDTVKRFAMEAHAIGAERPFPSTSSIAAASFVEQLIQAASDPSEELEAWKQLTGGKLESKAPEATQDIPYLADKCEDSRYAQRKWLLRLDGDLYFTETFVTRRLEEDYRIPGKPEAEKLAEHGKKALKNLLKATDALKISRPTPYYAVVQMDGDNMGMVLSGVQSATEHHDISQALSTFSRKTALELVQQQYPARLVYAGGDDVLAFAPLARGVAEAGQPGHVLSLAEMLQEKYRAGVIEALPKPHDEERVQSITASAGVVIAHHYTSLSYVLRSAREAEGLAKKRYGRNTLVVTLIRRSGEQTRVGCRWHYPELGPDDHPGQPIALFSRFYQLFKGDVLSPKCVYNLLEEAPALVKVEIEEAHDGSPSSSAMQSEIKRILKRQRESQREADFPDSEANQYAWYLTRLAAAIDADEYPHQRTGELRSAELHAESRRYGLVEVLGWLLVMVFLARKEQE